MISSLGDTAQLSTSNTPLIVTMANARTSNRRHDDVIADLVARDPDVIAVLEVSTALAEELTGELSDKYQYSTVHPQDDGHFGIAMFSRYPMENSDTFTLNLDRVRSIETTIKHTGNDYLIAATHPVPPIGRRGFEARNTHLVLLAQRLNSRPEMKHRLVRGDLNVTPWSPIYADFMEATKLRRAQVGLDITPTWYRGPGIPFGLILDHGLISPDLKCVSHEVGPDIGSDHRSVTIKVAPMKD
jgi:endonuclease/exonuclease/phosphatase (EEP) superfamily protein YafD